jgi:uncharacterized protein (DUF736 family)
MPEYDNELQGALFKNDKKQNDKHPDYKGQCEIGGQKLWISAWINKSKAGETYMKLHFEYPQGEEPRRAAPAQQQVPVNEADFRPPPAAQDEDIPF